MTLKVVTVRQRYINEKYSKFSRYFIICGNYGQNRYERKCKQNSELMT